MWFFLNLKYSSKYIDCACFSWFWTTCGPHTPYRTPGDSKISKDFLCILQRKYTEILTNFAVPRCSIGGMGVTGGPKSRKTCAIDVSRWVLAVLKKSHRKISSRFLFRAIWKKFVFFLGKTSGTLDPTMTCVVLLFMDKPLWMSN